MEGFLLFFAFVFCIFYSLASLILYQVWNHIKQYVWKLDKKWQMWKAKTLENSGGIFQVANKVLKECNLALNNNFTASSFLPLSTSFCEIGLVALHNLADNISSNPEVPGLIQSRLWLQQITIKPVLI